MNSAHIVATAAFLLLLSQFNNAHAAGPYDGEWTGTATSTGERCKPAFVTLEGRVVLGQAKFARYAPNINGTVDEDGAFGGTIGFQPIRGQFMRDEFEGPSRASIANGRLFSGARGKALAIEDALHHELYTALAPNRFKEFWREWVQSVPATPATRAWALGQQLAAAEDLRSCKGRIVRPLAVW